MWRWYSTVFADITLLLHGMQECAKCLWAAEYVCCLAGQVFVCLYVAVLPYISCKPVSSMAAVQLEEASTTQALVIRARVLNHSRLLAFHGVGVSYMVTCSWLQRVAKQQSLRCSQPFPTSSSELYYSSTHSSEPLAPVVMTDNILLASCACVWLRIHQHSRRFACFHDSVLS